MAARLFPEELDYTAHLRTAGGLSAGCFIMAIGAFLLLKGFFAESFIELFVGGIIIFYMIPKTRQDWSIRLVATTMIITITVVITTLLALFVLLENLPHILGN